MIIYKKQKPKPAALWTVLSSADCITVANIHCKIYVTAKLSGLHNTCLFPTERASMRWAEADGYTSQGMQGNIRDGSTLWDILFGCCWSSSFFLSASPPSSSRSFFCCWCSRCQLQKLQLQLQQLQLQQLPPLLQRLVPAAAEHDGVISPNLAHSPDKLCLPVVPLRDVEWRTPIRIPNQHAGSGRQKETTGFDGTLTMGQKRDGI